MDFKTQLKTAHDTIAAAGAPAYLRRDSDAGRAAGVAPQSEARQIPFHRANSDLVYELDEQAQLLLRLYDRLDGVLESVPCDPDQPRVDAPDYTNSALVVGMVQHASRVRNTNRQLADILARLAI